MIPKVLGDYKIGRTLGEGAFSKVKLAVHLPSQEKVAIKIIDKKRMAEANAECEKDKIEREQKKRARAVARGQPVPPEEPKSAPAAPDPNTPSFFSNLEVGRF